MERGLGCVRLLHHDLALALDHVDHRRLVLDALDDLDRLGAADQPQRWAELEELLSEGVVEPSVEERVAAGGRHGDDVAAGESRVVVLPAVEVDQLEVCDQVDEVDWQPHGPEEDDHAHQHPVGLAHSLKRDRNILVFKGCHHPGGSFIY